MAEKIQALRNELSATEQRIAEINGRRAYVIRAPMPAGSRRCRRPSARPPTRNSCSSRSCPTDSVLQAELFVPTRAIGFVETGQAVRILYEAFPYQHFGTYGGRIVKVSQTILTSADAAGPIELKEPAYRVTVALDRPDIDAYGKRMPLQPDMLLKADIILERRSLMSWLLNPLLQRPDVSR